jgi:hypothetical protein
VHHQQRCGDSFACHIADREEERLVAAGGVAEEADLAVVASDCAYGLVAILCFPFIDGEIFWQELELNLRCEIEVLLMVGAFLLVEVIETEAAERIEVEAIFFDGVVAGFAEAEASDLDLCESRIDFSEELVEIVVGD